MCTQTGKAMAFFVFDKGIIKFAIAQIRPFHCINIFLTNSGIFPRPRKTKRSFSILLTKFALIYRDLWFKKRECIDRLLEIDRIEPEKLERAAHYLCGFLEGLKPQKKTA
jgi:hypothetical protein